MKDHAQDRRLPGESDTLQGTGDRQAALVRLRERGRRQIHGDEEETGYRVPRRGAGLASKAETERAVNALLEAIRGALASGETVSPAGFGTFPARSRAARQGRNPGTGEGRRRAEYRRRQEENRHR